MTLFVTRHAQPEPYDDFDGPVGYRPLTELGRRQARKLGDRLVEDGFSGRVYTSPFHRCLETADRICERTGTVFRPEPALTEKSGDWIDRFTGLHPEEMRDQYSRCADGVDAVPWPWWPDAPETEADVRKRIGSLLETLVEEGEQDALVVGHGSTCRAVVDRLSDLDGDEFAHYNAALTAIEVSDPPATRLASDTAHLGDGEVTNNERVVR